MKTPESSESASAWQPIETAPRNGTKILLWCAGNPSGEWPFMATWDPYHGFWVIHVDGQSLHEPTHWTPLPDPPE